MFGFRGKAWFGKVNFENGYSCATMRINKKCWRVKKSLSLILVGLVAKIGWFLCFCADFCV